MRAVALLAGLEPGDRALEHEVVTGRVGHAVVDEGHRNVDHCLGGVPPRRQLIEGALQVGESVDEQRVEKVLLGGEVVGQRLLA